MGTDELRSWSTGAYGRSDDGPEIEVPPRDEVDLPWATPLPPPPPRPRAARVRRRRARRR